MVRDHKKTNIDSDFTIFSILELCPLFTLAGRWGHHCSMDTFYYFFMVLDLVYKFQMICLRGTLVIEQKTCYNLVSYTYSHNSLWII